MFTVNHHLESLSPRYAGGDIGAKLTFQAPATIPHVSVLSNSSHPPPPDTATINTPDGRVNERERTKGISGGESDHRDLTGQLGARNEKTADNPRPNTP